LNITIRAHKDIAIAFRTRETAILNKCKEQIARAADTAVFQPLAMTIYGSISDHTKKLITSSRPHHRINRNKLSKQFHNQISSIIVRTREIVFNHCTDKTQSGGTEDPETANMLKEI
jgi:hypothetical protein